MTISDEEREHIRSRVDIEMHKSITKHGNWSDYSYADMYGKIRDEMRDEVRPAIMVNDHHGPHGSLAELTHVIVTSMKAMVQIMRREGIQP